MGYMPSAKHLDHAVSKIRRVFSSVMDALLGLNLI